MPAAPTVSVVMPVYNTAGYVADTIDSILAQTFTDFELLILDDGSTDGTPAVLKRYADRDPRVKVVTRENKGIIDSRNELLALARGRYMAANDADDLSVPDRLAVQVAYMDAHPEVVLLGSRVVEMDPYGSPVFVTGQPLTHEEIEKQLLDNLGGWAIVQSSMICRTDAARKVGGYDRSLGNPCFSEDHDFFVRLAEVGRVANLERPLAWYRRHYSSTTRTYYLKKLEQHRRMKEQVLRGAHARRGLPFPNDWKFSPIVAPPRDEQARRWGWAALKHGNVAVARRHAAEAVKRAPWKPASLKLWLAAKRRDVNEKGQTFPQAYSNVGATTLSAPAAGSTDTKTMDANPTSGTPTVSVLMSVYNGGAYLRPCLDSLLSQTLRDVEFVIVDDGSKDGSPDVLREYAAKDARIKLTVRPNKGLTKTLNECFAQARGEFLARMDCDDVCYPDRFEKQVAFLRARPDVVCAGGYFDLIDEEGRKLTTLMPPTEDAEIQRQVLKGHGAICHPSAMIRANALKQIGGYCEDFKTAQDIDLWLRIGEVGRLANLPTPVLRFRLHETSVSESKRHEQRQSAKTACERAWKRRGIDGAYEADEPWRPGKDKASRHKFALQYGWWAFNAGEKATARHYAWRAIKAVPTKAEGWKLLAALRSSFRLHPSSFPAMPLISCMIPCRNGEPFIESAVRSVLDQEGVDLEVVVMDDGSTDTSRQTVLGIGDKRVRVIDGPRAGLAAVTNAALPHMRGELFIRNDADDLYPPGRLKFQHDWMVAHREFDALCGKFDMITRAGDYVSTVGGPPDGGPDVACEVTAELAEGVTRTHWNAWMFRTEVVRKLGGCRGWFTLGDDLDLMMRHAPHHRVWYEPQVWYKYRLHEGTAAHSMPNNRRIFFEEQAKRFIKQRVATGTDDLEQGKAPPIPEAGTVKPYYAKDQIQNVLIGRAWKEHAAGQKGTAIKTGMKALFTKPANVTAWKTLAALVVKKPK